MLVRMLLHFIKLYQQRLSRDLPVLPRSCAQPEITTLAP
jgi:hypothetical protein